MEIIEYQKAVINNFKALLEEYIVPLFDTDKELELDDHPEENKGYVTCACCRDRESYQYNFYPTQSNSKFHFKLITQSSDRLKKPVSNILGELMTVDRVNLADLASQRVYDKKLLDTAFELGMCKWLTSTNDESILLYSVISNLKAWTGRTYEGDTVPFGIVIDFSTVISSPDKINYLSFLQNNNCAVFTDGVFSGVLLDKNGDLISYITNSSFQNAVDEKIFVPYPHENISKYCDNNKVGLIVLANGEILLVKKRAIKFAWRDSKWVFFDWRRATDRIRPYFDVDNSLQPNVIFNYIRELYCTLLDVSFSHSGGCLCIIAPTVENTAIDLIIKERVDSEKYIEAINNKNQEKLKFVKKLIVSTASQNQCFFDLEKPLRKEILAMDGATAVFVDGRICCAGSIVAVEGSSTGGGRTAAAKTLAKLGVGIKISEDGAIEAYGAILSSDGSIVSKEPKKLFKMG